MNVTPIPADFERFLEAVILHRDRSPLDFDDGDEAVALRYVRWLESRVFGGAGPSQPPVGGER